jgi:hypothetical protein
MYDADGSEPSGKSASYVSTAKYRGVGTPIRAFFDGGGGSDEERSRFGLAASTLPPTAEADDAMASTLTSSSSVVEGGATKRSCTTVWTRSEVIPLSVHACLFLKFFFPPNHRSIVLAPELQQAPAAARLELSGCTFFERTWLFLHQLLLENQKQVREARTKEKLY